MSDEITQAALHYMMRMALIEIRAADNLGTVRKLADTFHNLPSALLNCSGTSDYEAQYQRVLDRAKRNGLDAYIRELRVLAMKSTKDARGDVDVPERDQKAT